MGYSIFFNILPLLIWPAVIIGLIVFFARRQKKKSHPARTISQFFLFLSVLFLGVTLLAFNRDFGEPWSWRTILLLTSAAGLASAYYFKVIYTLGFSLIGIVSWWGAQIFEWSQGKNIKTSAIFAGLAFVMLLFYVLGRLHEKEFKFKHFARLYLILGIMAMTGILFFLSTKPGLAGLEEMTKGTALLGSWQIVLSLLLLAGFLIGATTYTASQKLISSLEILAVALHALLFMVIALLPPQALFIRTPGELSSIGILWAVIFNLVIFFELLGLIFSGYLRREGWLINLGALFLFLLIIVKYFDWFFTFLDKSIFFIGAGLLLFVVGWLMERGRRYMISNIKTESR